MTQTAQAVTLRGSVATVTEYFGFAINNILYQRGIYPADEFEPVTKYGMTLMISANDELNTYLAEILQQVSTWVMRKACRKLVLLITRPADGQVLERWVFNVEDESVNEAPRSHGTAQSRPLEAVSVEADRWRTSASEYFQASSGQAPALSTSPSAARPTHSASPTSQGRKDEATVRKEIQSVMRQITACVTFLPVLDGPCAFDLLVYTHTDVEAPTGETWEMSAPQLIEQGSEVKLKTFCTSWHSVDTTVSYRE